MSKLLLPFHSYEHRAKQFSSRRLVNCYAEQAPTAGKSPLALLRAPGIRTWVTLPTGPVRGMCMHADVLYVVSGAQLYRISAGGRAAECGTIPGSARVSMASNGVQLVIVTNPAAYIYDGSLTQISDVDFTSRGAAQVAVVDSFALFIEPHSGRFFHSDLLDASSYDSLNFATAEAYPDRLTSILVDHREVFLFGTGSVELWYNQGGAGSPFTRSENGIVEVGCGAAWSPAKADNTVYWVDHTRIARRLRDLVPERCSTHAIEQKWASYRTIADAYSFAYVHEGHHFWCVTFPSGGDTFVFDIAANEWHERRSRRVNGGDECWRAAAHAFCYGMNIVGDSHSGKIGIIDPLVYTEFDEILRMEWTYPSVYGEGRRAFHRRLQIETEAGVGLTTGQGSSPEIMLYASDDGGLTFDAVPNRSVGEIGRYRHRSTWNRLGVSDDRVYRAAISDPVPVTVFDTQLEVEGGRL